MILTADKDPMGNAITDYWKKKKASRLRVLSSMFDEDELPVAQLFRSFRQMPVLEQKALQLASGKILDVGAGSGCHSLVLQEAGKEVYPIDISPLSIQVMQERGLPQAALHDFFDSSSLTGKFDTILMLMNGSGIIGKLERIPFFFKRLEELLTPNGCVLMDSSDLRYLFENEDGSFDINLNADYYGEVDFQMKYKNIIGEKFDWLYIDFQTLSHYALQAGFQTEMLHEGKHFDYLVRIMKLPI